MTLYIFTGFPLLNYQAIAERRQIEIKDNEFEKSMKFVFERENGLVEDKDDPGGLTKYGISQKSYPYIDIKNLTPEKAEEIYYRDYWLKADCDKMSFPFNLIVFDTAVHCGRSKAKKFLTNSLGWEDYLFNRIEFYASLKTKIAKKRLRGWVNRVIILYKVVKEEMKE